MKYAGPRGVCTFPLDGNQLAAANPNAWATCVWDLREPNASPVVLEGRQDSVTFSPDGSRLATVAFPSRDVLVWELARSAGPKITLRGHRVSQVAFSNDGIHVAGAGSDGVWIWDLQQPDAPAQSLPGQENMTSIAYSRDGNWLASGGADNNVRIWDQHQPKFPPLVLTGHQSSLWSVSFALNDNRLVSSSQDIVRVWDLRPPSAPPLVLSGHRNAITSVAFAPDSIRLASVGAKAAGLAYSDSLPDNTVRVWDLRQRSAGIVLEHPDLELFGAFNPVSSVAFSPDGNHLAESGLSGGVRLWDLKRPETPRRVIHNASEPVVFSSNGSRLATQCTDTKDDTVCVWNLVSPKDPPIILSGQKGVINSIAFGPDGEHVAASSDDSDTARVWDLQQPRTAEIVLSPHVGKIHSIAFADNGALLATADDDFAVRIWDLHDPGAPRIVLRGHQGYVKSIVFARGSDRLASGSWDGTVRIWDLRQPDVAPVVITGQHEKVSGSSEAYITSVALSPDGNSVALGVGMQTSACGLSGPVLPTTFVLLSGAISR